MDWDFFGDSAVTILVVVFIAVILTTLGFTIYHYSAYKCVQSHTEIQHKNAYTSYITSGKVVVPIHHPEQDINVTICDKEVKR